MTTVNLPSNARVRMHCGSQNYLNNAIASPGGMTCNTISPCAAASYQGGGDYVLVTDQPVGTVGILRLSGPGQYGTVTEDIQVTITAPLPPPPDPTFLDHFVPTFDAPYLP